MLLQPIVWGWWGEAMQHFTPLIAGAASRQTIPFMPRDCCPGRRPCLHQRKLGKPINSLGPQTPGQKPSGGSNRPELLFPWFEHRTRKRVLWLNFLDASLGVQYSSRFQSHTVCNNGKWRPSPLCCFQFWPDKPVETILKTKLLGTPVLG